MEMLIPHYRRGKEKEKGERKKPKKVDGEEKGREDGRRRRRMGRGWGKKSFRESDGRKGEDGDGGWGWGGEGYFLESSVDTWVGGGGGMTSQKILE